MQTYCSSGNNRSGIYKDCWQAFAALLPIRSVMGDQHLRLPDCIAFGFSEDGMTADWARVPTTCWNYFQPYCQRSSRRQPGGLHYV